jgi:hypothetical protein
VKSALLAVFVVVNVSACGLFEKKGAPEPAPSPASTRPKLPTAVPPEELAAALPKSITGWASDGPQSFAASAGDYQLARSVVNFKQEIEGKPATFSVEIIDGTHVPSVKSQLALLMHAADDVHRMELTASGYHGTQQWQPSSGDVAAFVVVANRFLIKLVGHNVSPLVFRQTVDAIDVRKLERLAGVAPNEQHAAPGSTLPSSTAATASSTMTAPVTANPSATAH